ncbi:MAG: HAMP domain-containing methyl-accepting chemotaxis protein [Coriobacteriia bacterium]|nr:HAMP domain-containing methyl-accepting chemotaxis protein [Coriobacteriia bacterium]
MARRNTITVRESLETQFAIRTWATIGPAVLFGLLVCAVIAWIVFKPTPFHMLEMVVFGGIAMIVVAVPGQMAWSRAFRSRILVPLREVGEVMSCAGEGDLTVRASIHNHDEIGVLTDECNRLIESLGDIAGNVRRSAESVSAAATELSASSEEINSSTMEISTSVQQIAHGAELQSRKVEETTSAVEAIVATVNTVSEQANQATLISQEAARYAAQGREATDEAVNKIAEVQTAIETLAASVELLGHRSSEIGKIVDVITSIADQTNLLSLNAAIEAARAGESGRGFAVVAEEVGKLAEGSGKAAEQIGELIKEVQTETAKAVKYMEIGTREVAMGTQVVGRSGTVLADITDAVQRTAGLADRIAASMAEQRDRTVAVDRAMHDIAAVVEQNAASAEETAAAAEEQTACMQEVSSSAQDLADMAHRLEESVHIFRIEGDRS